MLLRTLISALSLSVIFAATPLISHAGSWKYKEYKGDDYKDEYWDGPCKVDRKWKSNGEYKEKRKCKGGYAAQPPAVIYQPEPAVVISPQVVIRP